MSNKNVIEKEMIGNVLRRAHRIAVIGNAGSGKSTVASALHTILGLPVYHLDQYFWKPNWTPPNRDEYKIIHDALCDQDQWIIDGTNLSLSEHRMNRADAIIILKIPRMLCVWRIFKRTFTYYGKQTPSSAQGCCEGFSWKFIQFLKWVWNFEPKYNAKLAEILETYGKTKAVWVLSSQKEIDEFLKNIS